MVQIASLEDQVRSIKMRQDYYIEENKGYKERLEGGFKIVNEQTSLLVNDLVNRVAVLDDALKKEETRTSLLMQKAGLLLTISWRKQNKDMEAQKRQ